jgi:hypothetical protein
MLTHPLRFTAAYNLRRHYEKKLRIGLHKIQSHRGPPIWTKWHVIIILKLAFIRPSSSEQIFKSGKAAYVQTQCRIQIHVMKRYEETSLNSVTLPEQLFLQWKTIFTRTPGYSTLENVAPTEVRSDVRRKETKTYWPVAECDLFKSVSQISTQAPWKFWQFSIYIVLHFPWCTITSRNTTHEYNTG